VSEKFDFRSEENAFGRLHFQAKLTQALEYLVQSTQKFLLGSTENNDIFQVAQAHFAYVVT